MAERKRVGIEQEPLISIVTINYNQVEVTCEFLESARTLTYQRYEIIVVDNASTVNPTPQIEARNNPKVRVILNEKNLGFTGGNNVGIEAARGDYVFIVNNDTELTPNLLDELLAPFLANERIGVTCPKIRFYHQPDVIQYAGYGPMNHFTGTAVTVGGLEVDRGQHDRSGPTHFAHGCAMMVKREVIEKVGAFANQFFLYYEELDWSLRILKAGYLIHYQATALIFHKESVSVGKHSPLKVYYLTRNRILLMRRHNTPVQKVAFFAFFGFLVTTKHLISYALRGQFTYVKAFVRGIAWNVKTPSESFS
jgi:GT2 family glycosyltransferase